MPNIDNRSEFGNLGTAFYSLDMAWCGKLVHNGNDSLDTSRRIGFLTYVRNGFLEKCVFVVEPFCKSWCNEEQQRCTTTRVLQASFQEWKAADESFGCLRRLAVKCLPNRCRSHVCLQWKWYWE